MAGKRASSPVGKKVGSRMQLRFYGVALLFVVFALGVTLLLLPWLYPTTTPLFFMAVMVSAWYGGWRAGLLVTILSTLAINYFFIELFYSLHIINLNNDRRIMESGQMEVVEESPDGIRTFLGMKVPYRNDQQQAIQAGFQRHLSKPIKPNGLIQAVANLIKRTG